MPPADALMTLQSENVRGDFVMQLGSLALRLPAENGNVEHVIKIVRKSR